MSKRKRDDREGHDAQQRTGCHSPVVKSARPRVARLPKLLPLCPRSTTPVRRSARLKQRKPQQKRQESGQNFEDTRYLENGTACAYLPSPTSSLECRQSCPKRSKREAESDGRLSYGVKRRNVRDEAIVPAAPATKHPDSVTYWVHEQQEQPPASYFGGAHDMSTQRSSSKRPRSESSGTGRMTGRQERMQQHGICMDDTMRLNQASRSLCDGLLLGDQTPAGFPVYGAEHWHAVRLQVATEAEAIIQRDILPTVVPSAQILHTMGVVQVEHLRDEIDALWSRASTMGDTQPKLDYMAGLRRTAFDQDAWDKLMNYATPDTPVLLTTTTCFPLVVAEVKRGTIGLQEALYQVVHAGAIAVRQQVQLLRKAYGDEHAQVQGLYGQALVYSICLNHDEVHILAHYALRKEGQPDQIEYFYCKLGIYSLNMNNSRDQNRPYTFVENVYKTCGPAHVRRIREAAERLEAPSTTLSTGASFVLSELELDHEEGVEDSQEMTEREVVFKKPKPLVNANVSQELTSLRRVLEAQRADSRRRDEQSKQREEQSKQREEQSKQREEQSKQREERLETQLRQQKEESKQQVDQLREIIALLKAGRQS